ncbi:hypothetical protein BAUCODRAFT_217573 [Baudoinia panamericana UAMH 10762]|uniref:Uncharacterized protein n=1 Tax=Baudoinia panamericana (strain UAMH 10762) TaxID=717646 RepID=M2LIL7_BAUPA|nr:uncharacterized protein BAUCODRAFT_217573 [Baudoinia panamericana UAMH 10762]EMC94002.1 hypothetical protein BAUCODRAFT_217573 [Baudoinia panamericana UAMH 10762]
MAQPSRQPKMMSSRLLTMKFMQRSAGSPPSPAPTTPSEPPSKKQRLSYGSSASTPSRTPRSDAKLVREALEAEESKRAQALEREAADRGETKWYLSFKETRPSVSQSPLRVVPAGYAALDTAGVERSSNQLDDEVFTPSVSGRRSFGNFNNAAEVCKCAFTAI